MKKEETMLGVAIPEIKLQTMTLNVIGDSPLIVHAWSGVDWRAEAGHGKVRHALAGMVGFGWSGKGLTGQSWEWQVWNQKKGETKWFTKKSIHGEQAKACLHK